MARKILNSASSSPNPTFGRRPPRDTDNTNRFDPGSGFNDRKALPIVGTMPRRTRSALATQATRLLSG